MNVDLLKGGAKALGFELREREIEEFRVYMSLLLEWNEKINLTRITDPDEIVIKHFLDSLTCFKAAKFPRGARVVDVGTGAGFPGLPIAIVRPDLNVVLMDATKKRLLFLQELQKAILSSPSAILTAPSAILSSPPAILNQPQAILSLSKDEPPHIELIHARGEDAGRSPEHRERYDIVLARAVAEMRVLVEYCLPLARVGGVFIAMKGPDIDAELALARPGIGTLGGARPEVVHLTLPGTDIPRGLVVINKVKPTPEGFPRRGSQIAKRAL